MGSTASSAAERAVVRTSLGFVVAAFPVATTAVHAWDADRGAVAGALAAVFTVGVYAAVTVPWWAERVWSSSLTIFWPSPTTLTNNDGDGAPTVIPSSRLERAVLTWLPVTYTIHLTWELGYLLLHDAIARSPDAAWSYAWWAYIDGGDTRYAEAPPDLIALEALSVVNGAVGMIALVTWWRLHRRHSEGADDNDDGGAGSIRHTGKRDGGGGSVNVEHEKTRVLSVLTLMATSIVHIYSALLYYSTEILAGLPHVDTDSVSGLWVKFVGTNSPWLIMPWMVLAWGETQLCISNKRKDD